MYIHSNIITAQISKFYNFLIKHPQYLTMFQPLNCHIRANAVYIKHLMHDCECVRAGYNVKGIQHAA